jgi:uncharacterized protein (TIGR03086 family)
MIDLEPATNCMAELVRGVRDDQLGAATPCPDYTLGDLLDHVGRLALAFAAAAAKATSGPNMEMPTGDASHLADDWRTRIPADLGRLAEAWRDPGAWEGTTRIAGGEASASVVGQFALNELVVHGWDVARATGQHFDVDAEVVEACLRAIDPISQPGMEQAREPAFGPVIDVGDDRPRLDQLLGCNGRDPGWSPA